MSPDAMFAAPREHEKETRFAHYGAGLGQTPQGRAGDLPSTYASCA